MLSSPNQGWINTGNIAILSIIAVNLNSHVKTSAPARGVYLTRAVLGQCDSHFAMFIFLALFYLSLVSTRAAPLDIVSGGTTANNLVLPTYVSPPNQRTVSGILWNCFVTISLCTWTSVHPNIPGPGEKEWKVTYRRIELMLWALLAPELILLWSLGQHTGALELRKKVQGECIYVACHLKMKHLSGLCNIKWTLTHGHVVQMGGFMLMDGNVSRGVLTAKTFLELLEEKRIDLPTITEEEILDRSKGDGLSKVIAIVQAIWFGIQFILRGHQGLLTTEIEWITFALAAVNLNFFLGWWNKPLDIRCTIPVSLKSKHCILVQQEELDAGRS